MMIAVGLRLGAPLCEPMAVLSVECPLIHREPKD